MEQRDFQERVLDKLDEHSDDLTAIKVTLAKDYVTRAELSKQRNEAIIARRFAITSIIGVVGIGLATIFNIF